MASLTGKKTDPQVRDQYAEDQRRADLLPELLRTVASAEHDLKEARAAGADTAELNRCGTALDTALTEAVRAAYAKERALVGPRGYTDRIYRRKKLAAPKVRRVTETAERLLTARESHRLHGIEEVPRQPVAA